MSEAEMDCNSGDSGTDVLDVKSRILRLLTEVDEPDLADLEQWIRSRAYKQDLQKLKILQHEEKQLKQVSTAVKTFLPPQTFDIVMPTEHLVVPSEGSHSDCNQTSTCNIDEFLYDDEEVDKLVKDGVLHRHYCIDCGSRKIKELNFISHSLARQTLLYIFRVLLPRDLAEHHILDIGSRLGSALYAGCYFSNAKLIVGVEMNAELCNLQENILVMFNMDPDRVKVICSDIMNQVSLIQHSTVIIIDVFDFFVDKRKHIEMWHFFKRNIRKNAYVVTTRSVEETLDGLGIYEEFFDWLEISQACQPDNEILFDIEDKDDVYLYRVN